MSLKKNIFVIIGSASRDSANEKLMEHFAGLDHAFFNVTVFKDLKTLPHFDPELSIEKPPLAVMQFRSAIEKADGIIICTPEYVFSIPSGLKNAIEWCVSTTVFSDKPMGLVTASADGQKGHEELLLIMKTMMAKFTAQTTLLIQGVKGKINGDGQITDDTTRNALAGFMEAFAKIVMD